MIGGLGTSITDVNLVLNQVSHTFPDDVDLLLVGPGGQNAIVMSDAGGGAPGISNVNLTLDDQAASALPDATAPTSGSYQPANYAGMGTESWPAPAPAPGGLSNLSVFNGTNPNGVWNLYVVDDAPDDAGTIAGWNLVITTGPPPPPPPPPPRRRRRRHHLLLLLHHHHHHHHHHHTTTTATATTTTTATTTATATTTTAEPTPATLSRAERDRAAAGNGQSTNPRAALPSRDGAQGSLEARRPGRRPEPPARRGAAGQLQGQPASRAPVMQRIEGQAAV